MWRETHNNVMEEPRLPSILTSHALTILIHAGGSSLICPVADAEHVRLKDTHLQQRTMCGRSSSNGI